MDSDNASTTPPAGKIHRCSCGRRMSSLIHDFHSVCAVCRGGDCDTDHRCPECKDIGDLVMTKYVTHKISLQHKFQSKWSKKDPVPAPVVADVAADVAVSEPPSSPVPPSVTSVSPVPVDDSGQLSGDKGNIMSQVKSLFDSFAQSFEGRFTSIDNRFSQVMSDSASNVVNVVTVSQDVITMSFSASSIVAGCSDPTPDRAPFAPYTGGLGTTRGGPAAIGHAYGRFSPIPYVLRGPLSYL